MKRKEWISVPAYTSEERAAILKRAEITPNGKKLPAMYADGFGFDDEENKYG